MTHDDTLKRAAQLLRESAHGLQLSHSLPPGYAFESIAEPEIIADILDHRNLAAALDALNAERDALQSMAHRLALDLECLLLSTDNPAATKWWAESNATLDAWRALNDQIHDSR